MANLSIFLHYHLLEIQTFPQALLRGVSTKKFERSPGEDGALVTKELVGLKNCFMVLSYKASDEAVSVTGLTAG